MWTVSKKEVADLLKLDLMSRLREARERTKLFEQTYEQSFEDFEQAVLHGEEDFGRWDDPDGRRDGSPTAKCNRISSRK